MKKALAPAVAIGAPEFAVSVSVFAWTEKQAERIRAQVAHMFTGAEVTISPVAKKKAAAAEETAAAPGAQLPAGAIVVSTREEAQAAVDKFAGALLAVKVPETKVAAALGALVDPTAAAAPASAAPQMARPFAVGDTLKDVHVPDRTVIVSSVDDAAFYFDGGSCPWASAECYEKVSAARTAAPAAAATRAKKARPGAPRDRATLGAGVKPRQPRAAKMIGAHKPAAKR